MRNNGFLPDGSNYLTPRNSAVSIRIQGNNITISTAFRFTSTLGLFSAEHRNWFRQGVEEYWSGAFNNVFGFNNVRLNTVVDSRPNRIRVIMHAREGIPKAQYGPISNQIFGTIWMYRGRQGDTFGEELFKWIAAHEFGHILGLDDNGQFGALGIMASPHWGNPNETFANYRVRNVEVEMLIRAYATNTMQSF